MPCKSCLVECDKSITKGIHKLNSNLVLVDCPCRDCLVRIMCRQSCLRESAWVLGALDNDYQTSDAIEHLRRIHDV